MQPAHAAHKKAHAATDAQAHIGTRDMEATAQVQLDIRCMRVQRVCVPLKMQTPSPGSVASSQTREGTKVPGKTQCNIEERKWERERGIIPTIVNAVALLLNALAGTILR